METKVLASFDGLTLKVLTDGETLMFGVHDAVTDVAYSSGLRGWDRHSRVREHESDGDVSDCWLRGGACFNNGSCSSMRVSSMVEALIHERAYR